MTTGTWRPLPLRQQNVETWAPVEAAPAAVEAARRAMRDEGWAVVATVLVRRAERDGVLGWAVTLEVMEG